METFSALLAICVGNSPVPCEFLAQRPVTRRFDVFFDLRLNKRLSKQSWGWWFETLSRPLWRHRNELTRTGTVSMAMHCLAYNTLTPDGGLANHVFDTAANVAVFDTGSGAFFFRIRHTAPLCTTWDHSSWNFTNVKCNTQTIGFRTIAHVTAPSSNNT